MRHDGAPPLYYALLHFWIEANAFCHQMVRSVVGTLVEVGRGKKRAGEMMGILLAGDRQGAGDLAPPIDDHKRIARETKSAVAAKAEASK